VGRLEVIGSECLIGCVGGVITLVSCPCLSVELNGRSVLVYRIMRMIMKSITPNCVGEFRGVWSHVRSLREAVLMLSIGEVAKMVGSQYYPLTSPVRDLGVLD